MVNIAYFLCLSAFNSLILPATGILLQPDDRVRLINDLMENYSPYVRPVLDISTVTTVTYGMAIFKLLEMDEVNQQISLSVWLRQRWNDDFLTWNPTEYGNVSVIRLPNKLLWRPDIRLYDNVGEDFLIIDDTDAIISSTGHVAWNAPAIVKAACPFNGVNVPFDTQSCGLKFGPWSYNGLDIAITSDFGEADLSNISPNGEWDVISANATPQMVYYKCCLEPYPDIKFVVVLKRRPLYYVFNILIPNICISLLTLVAFYLPTESGEKMSLMMTILLSLVVFQQLVNARMPQTSDLPYIGRYFLGMISMVSISVFFTVFVINIFHRDAREIPPHMRKFIFGFLAPAVGLGNKKKTHLGAREGDVQELDTDELAGDEFESIKEKYNKLAKKLAGARGTIASSVDNDNRLSSVDFTIFREREELRRQEDAGTKPPGPILDKQVGELSQAVKFLAWRRILKDRESRLSWEWQEMAQVVDRALMWLTAIYTLGFTAIMMLMAVDRL